MRIIVIAMTAVCMAAKAATIGLLSPTYQTNRLIAHFSMMGQSLAGGYAPEYDGTTNPILLTSAIHTNAALMWTNGIYQGAEGELVTTNDMTTFGNLVAPSSVFHTNYAETPIIAGVRSLLTLRTNSGIGIVAVLGTTHTQGGVALSSLVKGTAPYSNFVLNSQSAQRVIGAINADHSIKGIFVMHGETDSQVFTSRYSYKTNWLNLLGDYDADISATTGQTDPVRVYFLETAGGEYNGGLTNEIGIAQWELSRENPRFAVVAPCYQFLTMDGRHLPSTNYVKAGEYFGYAVNWETVTHMPWQGVAPQSVTVTSTNVQVTFSTPTSGLIFDTTWISDPGNLGFTLAGAATNGVPTISGTTVTIPYTSGGHPSRVRYAFAIPANATNGPITGIRGCLRSDTGFADLYVSGWTNFFWCPNFDWAIAP